MIDETRVLLGDAAVESLDTYVRQDGGRALEGSAMAPHANRCYLPVEHSLLIPSIARSFANEFEQHFHRGCQACRDIVLPKIVDFDASKASFTYVRDRHPALPS